MCSAISLTLVNSRTLSSHNVVLSLQTLPPGPDLVSQANT